MILVFLLIFLYPPLSAVLIASYLGYMLTSKIERTQFSKFLIILIAIAFATYGYGITSKPWLENDLYRYFDQLEDFSHLSLFMILKNDRQFLYTRDILFYFVSRTGNIRLLPFIVGFNIYGIYGYVLYDYIKRSDCKLSTFQILTLFLCTFFIINPTSVIANIRCVQAYTLVAFAIYREVIQKKKNIITVLLYFLALGLHVTTSIVIALQLFHRIFRRFGLMSVLVCLFFTQLVTIAYNYQSYFGSFFSNIISKAYFYFFEYEETDMGISERISRFVCFYYVLSTIFIILYHDHLYKNKKLMSNTFISYLYSMMIATLGALSLNAGAYWRFESIIVMFCVVYMVPLMQSKNRIINLYTKINFCIGLIMTLLNLFYILVYLDSYSMLENSLSLSGCKLLLDFCKGVYAF